MTAPATWEQARRAIVSGFGDELPIDSTEAAVLAAWRQQPDVVEAAAQRIAGLKTEGSVRSGWAVLRAELDNLPARAPETTADAQTRRDAAVDRADAWLRTVGAHVPSEGELLDELFGPRGLLRAWDCAELRERMLDRWRATQPQEAAA